MILRRISPYRVGLGSFIADFERVRRDMDRMFNTVSGAEERRLDSGVYPLVNLAEDGEKYCLKARLPGVAAENIELSVSENTLTLTGERVEHSDGGEVSYHRREREAGFFKRSVSLPGQIDPEGIEAGYRNGILTVLIPKSGRDRTRQIVIKAE